MFEQFKKSKQLVEQTDFVKAYKFLYNEKEYKIIITNRIANNHTIIHFIDDTIYWEQLPRFHKLAGSMYGDRIAIYKFDTSVTEKVKNTLFVIRGTPLGDEGLYNGIFRGPKKYDENFVNCMTYKKFKKLQEHC